MNKNDRELVDRYTRARHEPDAVVIEVQKVGWRGHRPFGTWVETARLPVSASEQECDTTRRAALADARYFATCDACGELNLRGHMSRSRSARSRAGDGTSSLTCHACSVRAGVVF